MKRRIVFFIGFLVYIISLLLPAWTCTSKQLIGADILAIGWMGIKIAEPRWFCNLAVFFAVLAFGDFPKKFHKIICFTLAAVATTSIFGPYYCGPKDGAFYPDGLAMGAGGYLWILALWLLAFSTLQNSDYRKLKGN